jgi:hypothetical protein
MRWIAETRNWGGAVRSPLSSSIPPSMTTVTALSATPGRAAMISTSSSASSTSTGGSQADWGV